MTPATRIPAIEDATASYEAWLDRPTPIVRPDLDVKHWRMSKDPFTFLRGTFCPVGATLGPVECRDDLDAPAHPTGIGDLHTENFGTWRDWDGRLIWGTNDFDEACLLPYTDESDPARHQRVAGNQDAASLDSTTEGSQRDSGGLRREPP